MTAVTVQEAVDAFLGHRRAVGRKYDSELAVLRLLARYAEGHGVRRLDRLSPGVIDDFLASRPRSRPRRFNHLLGVVAGMLDWAVSQQLLDTAPPLRSRRRRAAAVPVRHPAGPAPVGHGSRVANNSRAARRGPTYRTIYALSYGLGLRAGEVCGLHIGDVDEDRALLVVRGGKYGKTRLVPYGPRIAALLHTQLDARRDAYPDTGPDGPLFSFDGQRCIHPGTASQVFHHLMAELQLPVPDGVAPPRLHSLRHSFAVGCLLRWYRQGLDPAARLHHLSTFMGHVDPVSTAVYLQITPELLGEANRRFEEFAEPAWAQATS